MSEPQHPTSTREIANSPAITRALAIADVVLDMRVPRQIVISNDGKQAAFVVFARQPGEQKYSKRIWIVETDGSKEAQPINSGKGDESSPSWSPDGKKLAFAAQAGKERPQLYVIPAAGGDPELICKMPNGVSDLAWSPDGSRIAFLSLEGEKPGEDPLVLGPARYNRLWSVRVGQAIPEPITPPNLTVIEYRWSPDSTSLALYFSRGPEETDWYRGQIGVVAAHGGTVRQLTSLTLPARAPAWSQDGSQIAFLSGGWSDPGRGAGEIYSVSLKDAQVHNLTPGIESSPTWCAWLPDNRHLLFATVKGVTHQVAQLDSHTGQVTLLEKDFVMQGDMPTLAITPDGQTCVTIHSNTQLPNDVWSGKISVADDLSEQIEWRRLTALNPLAEDLLPRTQTERIRYQSVDEHAVYGLFTPPTTPGDALPPLYVHVHGGPSGAECDYWLGQDLPYLATGFAVFRPNYRGSWGQGAAFADAVLGDMGGKDLQDILSGIDYLVQMGKVDGNRIAIGGWSNGGFLSAWAVTQTKRFKAAMVGAGITDWHNMHAQTNIMDADILLLATDPFENPEAYRRCSPITYAANATTPTLVLHGKDDPAVPVAQAYAFYRALHAQNVPTECVIYPREGHGLGERDHVHDATERQLRWFEKFVNL